MSVTNYERIIENDGSTVVAEYLPDYDKKTISDSYETEAQLEECFINLLQEQGYEYCSIHNEEQLIKNLRTQLEKLNNFTFSDDEWSNFFTKEIANSNNSIQEKTKLIQEDPKITLTRDDGSFINVKIFDKKNIHNNFLQVINQYAVSKEEGAKHDNRYDVTVLINGLPMVHIELKSRGIELKRAFFQIERYGRESFFAGNGLFEYVQIFVISNGRYTKYYSNTTRDSHIKEINNKNGSKKKTSNTFEFTSFWADAKNKIIPDLLDFTRTFFARGTILNIIARYCVFTSDKMLMVLRPYQIVATERILNSIIISSNYKKLGTIEACGYIWHTTGSGKTLTSFKTAQLATQLDGVEKVLFVVDRKDLDYQTMKEYDKFEKGAADASSSTDQLEANLKNPNSKIVITTIQKLERFIKKYKGHEVFSKHIVIIFDECHRSQFGEMHKSITKAFKKYNMFGFTGTPIYKNGSSTNPVLKTTDQLFNKKLHSYTIVDAIRDENVLPFRIAYISTFKEKENIQDKDVTSIDREKALLDDRRINAITKYILDNFDTQTKRNGEVYKFAEMPSCKPIADNTDEKTQNTDLENNTKEKEIKAETMYSGFNSIFAVSSIEAAKKYYVAFKKEQKERQNNGNPKNLKIALIYSFAPNENTEDGTGLFGEENSDDTSMLDASSKEFLNSAIQDYNKMFGVSFDVSGDSFQNYYKDVSLRMKYRKIDMLIVVNMFLTGFDATTLNTLWVDKNLQMHGLIQAFSRTNRILNSVKKYGNIICFRDLEEQTNEAIAHFGNKDAHSIVILKTYEEYYYGYKDSDGKKVKGYKELVETLMQNFPVDQEVYGEENEKDFIKLYNQVLRARNILSCFEQFDDKTQSILSPRELQNYQAIYHKIYDKYRSEKTDKEKINDDLVFEIELIKHVDIKLDYILMLVAKYKKEPEKIEILLDINSAIGGSYKFRKKKDLIEEFIRVVNPSCKNIFEDWKKFVKEKLDKEIDSLVEKESLNKIKTHEFMNQCFEKGEVKTAGTELASLLPPTKMAFFGNTGRKESLDRLEEGLKLIFERYSDFV